jgi:GDSL-like Lipase/Acylhydrolase family
MTWNPVSVLLVTGGPVAASATPGSIGGGWIDATGSQFSITSGNLITAVTAGGSFQNQFLLRPSNETNPDHNYQIKINFNYQAPVGGLANSVLASLRVTSPTSNASGYIIGYNNGSIISDLVTAGGLSGLTAVSGPTTYTQPANGTPVYLIANCVQTSPTLTTLTVTLYLTANDSVLSATTTVSDSTSGMQNIDGQLGFNLLSATQGLVSGIETYTDVASYRVWNQLTSYTVAGGPVAAAPTPGSIGGGWIDALGSQFSITSGNLIQAVNNPNAFVNQYLLRPAGEVTIDHAYQTKINFIWSTSGGNTVYVAFRITGATSAANGYALGFVGTGSINALLVQNGSISGLSQLSGPTTFTGPSAGTAVYLIASCVQSLPYQTTITATLYLAADNSIICSTVQYTDITPSLQNIDGQSGIFLYSASEGLVSQLATYTTAGTAPWSTRTSYVVTGGPVAASPTPGSIGGGWIDATGSQFSITSGNLIQAVNSGGSFVNQYLVSPANQPNPSHNYQIKITFSYQAPSGGNANTVFAGLRITTPASNASSYLIGFQGGNISGYLITTGSLSALTVSSGTTTYSQPANGTSVYVLMTCVQTSPTLTTIYGSLYQTSNGALIAGPVTWTDSTVGMQNVDGQQGFNLYQCTQGLVSAIATYTDVPGFINPSNSAGCYQSPLNWAPDASAISAGYTGSVKAFNAGAYLRFYVTGASQVMLYLDSNFTSGYFAVQIDGGPLNSITGTPATGNTTFPIGLPDTGPHVIWVKLWSVTVGNGRWDGSTSVGVLGVGLPTGATMFAPTIKSLFVLLYGDSITEGSSSQGTIYGVVAADANQYAYSYYICEALYEIGYEYSIVGCAGQGYISAGVGAVLPMITIGNDANSAWDKVITGVTRLSGNLFSTQPNLIIVNQGTNDYNNNNTGIPLQQGIEALWAAFLVAAPKVSILTIVPFGGFVRADIDIAYATVANKRNFGLIDLNIVSRMPYYADSGGGIHPGVWGHANIASLMLPLVTNFISTSSGASSSGGGGTYVGGNWILGVP